MKAKIAFLGLSLLILASEAFAMKAEPTRLVVYRRGEAIAGDEFVAANEGVVDYLATLRRPTEALKGIRYNCVAKSRAIRPQVTLQGGTPNGQTAWLVVRTVYELRDCVEVQ